jgi:hypothetical protein
LKWPVEGYCPPARYEFQTVKIQKDTPLSLGLWDLPRDSDWQRIPLAYCHEKMALQQVYVKYFRVSKCEIDFLSGLNGLGFSR